ncbi:MAG: winged helix-turn-helix domain-containing protein [Nitrososphaerota archaeon]|nr:winged helix-turn-helix domain-containing protein [Candidatus Geocrenenecus dongiae]
MEEVNAKAYLASIRNVKRGVNTRSKILEVISNKPQTLKSIAREVGKSSSCIRRHLRNMEKEGIVRSQKFKGKKIWIVTGLGQKAIEEIV